MLLEKLKRRRPARPATAADTETAQLQDRYQQWRDAAAGSGREDWLPPAPSPTKLDAGDGIPEIAPDQLDADVISDALRNHGALIVRGLMTADVAGSLRSGIDHVISLAEQSRNGVEVDVTEGGRAAWHAQINDPTTGEPLGERGRGVNAFFSGSLPAADTPHLALQLLDFYQQSGLRGHVSDYLGEDPAVSMEKWVLRRVPPDTNTSWHQDGAFIGTDVRAVNLWVALSDCGETASGLDMVPRAFTEIVPTGTEGAFFDWDVSPEVVEQERQGRDVVSPVFQPGDAVIFDQYLLHRTGVKPGMIDDRYAVETWFFAPSHFPPRYTGLMA